MQFGSYLERAILLERQAHIDEIVPGLYKTCTVDIYIDNSKMLFDGLQQTQTSRQSISPFGRFGIASASILNFKILK